MTGPKINPDSRDIVDNSDDKAHLHEFIAKKFPKVDPNPSIEESCIYTVSPDNVHILDKHPKYPNIVVGCGFSGMILINYNYYILAFHSTYYHKMSIEQISLKLYLCFWFI